MACKWGLLTTYQLGWSSKYIRSRLMVGFSKSGPSLKTPPKRWLIEKPSQYFFHGISTVQPVTGEKKHRNSEASTSICFWKKRWQQTTLPTTNYDIKWAIRGLHLLDTWITPIQLGVMNVEFAGMTSPSMLGGHVHVVNRIFDFGVKLTM